MSALGHYLEEEGIATVAIALIRPQAENTKPPRALVGAVRTGPTVRSAERSGVPETGAPGRAAAAGR